MVTPIGRTSFRLFSQCPSAVRLIALILATTVAAAAEDDARAAIEAWRAAQYAGDADTVIADLAPAAPGFVDRRSNRATRDNVERIAQGSYGFAILDVRSEGDAAVATLLIADRNTDGPALRIRPFFMWRHDGRWTYLPNPLQVETWYQSVPDELEPAFDRLRTWHERVAEANADRLDQDAGTLLTAWAAETPERRDGGG